jgi:hypothetical protein
MELARPMLTVRRLLFANDNLDLVIANVGSMMALDITVAVERELDDRRAYRLDAIGAGGEAELEYVFPVSGSVALWFEYTDAHPRRFDGYRRLTSTDERRFRLVEGNDKAYRGVSLFAPLRRLKSDSA